jgi:hypothetical protein
VTATDAMCQRRQAGQQAHRSHVLARPKAISARHARNPMRRVVSP